jgi:flagellar biosynthesis protein FlhF
MQVKKFEAPTLQEALDTIKRELGPEAIILQTKQNRRGFGLMSKGSVEVTAAVSGRSLDKKTQVERRLPEAYTQKVNALPANKQADIYESYLEKKIEKDNVQLSNQKKRTAVRYADIADDENTIATKQKEEPLPQYAVPARIETAMENYSNIKTESNHALREEIDHLKQLVEDLRSHINSERNKPDYLDSDSPFAATDALQEAYEVLLHSGVEKRFSVQIMRETARALNVEARADRDSVLDAIADRLLKQTDTKSFFGSTAANTQIIHAFVGASGVGKTTLLAKLATHSARNRNEKMGVIRIQIGSDEGVDSLTVFAKALHVPYRVVTTAEELQVAIQDLSQCNRIFIDTPSVSLRDPNGIKKLTKIIAVNPQIKTHLVLSCTTRDLETQEQARIYSQLNPESILFSRMDETYSFGSIYSISSRLRLPVSIFSTGKKVTGDWEVATAERLTASILNIL